MSHKRLCVWRGAQHEPSDPTGIVFAKTLHEQVEKGTTVSNNRVMERKMQPCHVAQAFCSLDTALLRKGVTATIRTHSVGFSVFAMREGEDYVDITEDISHVGEMWELPDDWPCQFSTLFPDEDEAPGPWTLPCLFPGMVGSALRMWATSADGVLTNQIDSLDQFEDLPNSFFDLARAAGLETVAAIRTTYESQGEDAVNDRFWNLLSMKMTSR